MEIYSLYLPSKQDKMVKVNQMMAMMMLMQTHSVARLPV